MAMTSEKLWLWPPVLFELRQQLRTEMTIAGYLASSVQRAADAVIERERRSLCRALGSHASRTEPSMRVLLMGDSRFAVLRHHPLYDVAQELLAEARPRHRRFCGPPVEALNTHYAYAGRNEQPTLEELLECTPPTGGMAAYIADLNTIPDQPVRLTDREIALRARWWE